MVCIGFVLLGQISWGGGGGSNCSPPPPPPASGAYGHGDFKSVDNGREAARPSSKTLSRSARAVQIFPRGPVLIITVPHASRLRNLLILWIAA